jgi:hypothetical protein
MKAHHPFSATAAANGRLPSAFITPEQRRTTGQSWQGFTLIELLVVIAIIA